MNWKEFLGPEWKKFILPTVFIILFFVVLNSFYYSGSVMDKYGCELTSLVQELQTNYEHFIKTNDSSALNQTNRKIDFLSQEMQNDAKWIQNIEPILNFVKTIDPIIPVPCGTLQGNTCEFYMSEDTYNCFIDLESETGIQSMILRQPETKEYKKASIITSGLNVLLLFVEGYLISSIILFFYREYWKGFLKPN